MDDVDILNRRLARAKAEIARLESIIEVRSRSLFLAEKELNETADSLARILETLRSAVIIVDETGSITRANPASAELLQVSDVKELIGSSIMSFIRNDEGQRISTVLDLLGDHREVTILNEGGHDRYALLAAAELVCDEGELQSIVCVAADISDKKRMEVELRHAQKLESVGQLAAGIAHEINTPIQFVGDSLTFLQESHQDVAELRSPYDELMTAAEQHADLKPLLERIKEAEEDIDREFLDEETPGAFRRAIAGIDRVAKIVSAMKEFAHPGDQEMAPADLNRAISTTLTVAKAEYKYVAELETDLQDLPPVVCHLGDINQVVLNLVVNAAHAIEARLAGSDERGKIMVATRRDGSFVEVSVSDDGSGIPDDVVKRIFDPFFTTKAVGRGTGQGLALTHSIIVERHGGEVSVETVLGEGTTFHVRIPIESEVENVAA